LARTTPYRTISTCALMLTCSHVVLAADSESGSTVFHTRWFATNEAQPQAFSGLGPLFNAVSCAACHGTGVVAHLSHSQITRICSQGPREESPAGRATVGPWVLPERRMPLIVMEPGVTIS
jgi:hypothetical protein